MAALEGYAAAIEVLAFCNLFASMPSILSIARCSTSSRIAPIRSTYAP